MMLIIGIDPGASGGLAIIDKYGKIESVMTFKHSTYQDIVSKINSIPRRGYASDSIKKAYIELVHSMPAQGVSSSFKFGMHFGIVQGLMIALKIPFEFVTPQKWQKALSCMTKGDKNVTKRKAQELFPGEKITHGNADAILIAEYGRRIEYNGNII